MLLALKCYNSLSLFSDKRILEIDLGDQKAGVVGANALKSLAQNINPYCIVIIKGNKAGQDIQRSAWFKVLDKQGLFIPCYEISGNQIFIDNIDITDISLSSLRNLISIVPQDSFLFNDTIQNNIIQYKIGLYNSFVFDVSTCVAVPPTPFGDFDVLKFWV